ncbi:tRNA cyclic N6-threonylcarbamoyladenosine(37) synthase TcdA [Desulfuromonas acetoxidans]|uniref:UBA/THIF-type NAD/FAD binding fold n=1 Tax=Desulfuromonas acetoxidans (strain DSM 684 / 11070) TaxID=281689 RepID=Q1JXP6_DESA6|nr:tRNA cyclic N6-threonylcarbamoyladenosine(37) synthase TcdA [Desulfuromonas acetoxidans]EAT15097.1 UBA/THIF-type NAD/FAD binding fold [Desulfuromonas acetoxidans DSM 684]MBF0645472.1 tRNA cyclic N6-threonylcarbamoyladenosine(37) synthase TcdA [Desulfuromonas acetoxidans]NVD25327.1 tRNA cyclic N6-threonylcarbamoyladenosine(37) synthase TcdA [Desulfuromonas acetoxidans]NVE17379.1 tRNA cyclic N6-threonylcarbamoyladenosine(37) synthase TcdA [Desulfuromonas acetoxidans]
MTTESDIQRFSRSELLLGEQGLIRLAQSHVAVFGMGGVGSYAVEALARSGIGALTLIDYDRVCVTNINRQLFALDSTVDRVKVEVAAERCRMINPSLRITALCQRYTPESGPALLAEPFDFVLDCIDTITAKLDLIRQCKERQLPVISSMGAANKTDTGKILQADLFETHNCRLARIMRKELRKRGVENGVPVVYSTEEYLPDSTRPSAPRQKGVVVQRPPMGSLSTVPPVFGLMMAGFVINRLAGVSS